MGVAVQHPGRIQGLIQLKAKAGNVTQLWYAKLNSSANFITFRVTLQFNLQTCVCLYMKELEDTSVRSVTAWGRQRLSFNLSMTFQGINCIFVPGDPSRTHAMHMPGLQPTFNISAVCLAYKQPLHFAHILLA